MIENEQRGSESIFTSVTALQQHYFEPLQHQNRQPVGKHGTKSAKNSISASARVSRAAGRRSAHGRTGVPQLRDTAVVLNSYCRALRNDSQLALVALLETGPATKYGRHLFQGCGSDWFATGDRALDIRAGRDCDAKIARLFEKCDEDGHIAFDTGAAVEPTSPSASAPRGSRRSNPLRDMGISQRLWFFAQLLSLIVAFDTLVLPLLPEKEKANVDTTTPYWSDENIHFVPMAIVLCLYFPKRQDTQHKWARDDVRKALNAYIGKLEDSFLSKSFQKAAATRFGAHWDCITPAPTTSTPTASSASLGVPSEAVVAVTQSHFSVKCDLCAKTTATMQYAKANRGCMEDLYTQIIRNKLVEGGFSAQEIKDRLHQLGRHTEYDLQGDDLLRHVLHQDLVDLPRVVCVAQLGNAELAKAFSEDLEFRVQCPKVYQPLRQFLLKHYSFTNRIYFHRIPKKIPSIWEISGFRYSKAELVDGVSRSGFFVGAVVITY